MTTTITKEMLEADSTKGRLQKYWEQYRKENNGNDPVCRNPNTCEGLLSKERLHELFTNVDETKPVFTTGLVVIDNDDVAFFSDDAKFGLATLPSNFNRFKIMHLHHHYGEGKASPNAEAIVRRLSGGKRFLNSIEELVDYLNREKVLHPA